MCAPIRLLLITAATTLTVFAAAPRLDIPIVGPNRSIQLTVRGDAGAEYSVEYSLNLSAWFLVSSGTAANGVLTLTHDASAYSTIFYRAKSPAASQDFAIFPEALSLNVGSEAVLFPLLATAAVDWSSSAAAIVTVDTNGIVKALAKGTATVTATSGAQSASSLITVYDTTGPNADVYTTSLISDARAKNTITAEQELIYRTYAAFGDSRLPAQFRGAPSASANHLILSEVASQIDSLTAAAQQILRPFLLPPVYAESWSGQQLSFRTPGGAGGGAGVTNANCTATALPGEFSIRSTPHFKIFARKMHVDFIDRGTEKLADLAAAVIEQIYVAETNLLQRGPLSDANEGCNGGDGSIDIYIVPVDNPVLYGATVAYAPGCVKRPSFIVLNRGGASLHRAAEFASPAEGARIVKAVLAHEFMHVLQFAMDRNPDCKDMEWFDEATAEWAMDFVDSAANYEDGFIKEERSRTRSGTFLTEYLRTDHTASIEKTGPGADESLNGYADYLFFQYLAREFGNDVIKQIYDATAGAGGKRSVEAVAAALGSHGGLKNIWPDFAATLWNDTAESSFDYWKQQDQYDMGLQYLFSSTGARIRGMDGPDLETIEVDQEGAPRARFKLLQNALNFNFGSEGSDYQIQPRSFYYDHLKFTDENVRSVLFFNPIAVLPAADREFIKVQGWTKIEGEWDGPFDWTEMAHKQFCRDKKSERLEELLILVSNSEANRGSEEPLRFPERYPMQVSTSNVGCWQWEGSSSTEMLGTDGTAHKATATDLVFEVLTTIPGIIYFETTAGKATGSQTTPLGACSITSGGALRPITKHAIPDGRLDYSPDLHLGLGEEPNRDVLTASGSTELFTTTIFRCPDFTQTSSDEQSWGWLDHASTNLTVSADGQTIEGNISEPSPIGVRKTIFKFTAKRE